MNAYKLKLMNNNTHVYINVPNANSFHRILAKEMGLVESIFEKSERNHSLQQSNIFDKISLIQLITNTLPDIYIKECQSFFIKPFTHDQMMKCLDQNIINNKVIDGFYKLSKIFPEVGCELYCFFSKVNNK